MTTHKARYELVFFGTDRQGAERIEALSRLAHWMQVAPEELGRILEERGHVIAENLDQATGTQAQRQLVALGIRANLRPRDASGLSLALVPKEKPATVITCPACGHIHRGKAEEPAPVVCKQCGISYAKYEKVAQEKLERERIRQSLLSEQQRRLEQEQRELAERQAQERRRQLEEEIRKQLGLPRMVASRNRLISSAAGIYLLGITMGAAGVYGYDLWFGSGASAGDSATRGGSVLAGGQAAGELDPGMAAAMQVSALLAAAPGALASASGAGASGPSRGDAGVGSPHGPLADAAPSSTQDAPAFLEIRLADLKSDVEWDLYVLSRINDLHERGATARAVALVDHLRNPDLRFDRGAWLADSLWHEGRATDADNLYLRLSAAAGRQPDTAGARVAAFCTLARLLDRVGRRSDADRLLQQANNIAATVTAPADRAAADSEIAALLSDLGRAQDARAYFQAATQGLGRIATPAERLSAIPAFARGFAKAGYRASALSFLEDASRNIESIAEPRERARVLGLIAETNGQLGDIQAAKGTAAQIPGRSERDRTLYRILGAEIASERLVNAIDLAQRLQTPAYRALGAGLLALQQQGQPAYRALAAQSSEQASAAVAALTDPAQRSAVVAEIGRFAVRGGDAPAADRHFADAYQLADAIPLGAARDQVLAILATNEALALRLADARKTLPMIADAPLRLALVGDLRGFEEAAVAAGP